MSDGRLFINRGFYCLKRWKILFDPKLFPMISIPILVLLVFFTLYKVAKDQPMFQAILINNDIESIYEKFKEIDDICGIIAITS